MTTTYQPNTLLVTGGAGFIGTNFVHYWLDTYPDTRIVVLDALTYAGRYENLQMLEGQSNFRFVHGDILDQPLVETLLREEGIDTIVHFAAESHVDRSIYGPDAFLRTNIDGTHSLLKSAKIVWLDEKPGFAHRFHHVSTDEVYGTLSATDPAFTETTPYAPNSPYAASKASSDHIVRAYQHTYGLQTTTSNCSNNYGPYQYPEKLIPLAISRLLQGQAVPIYGDGQQIRDWLYVDDHNRGIDLIIRTGRVGETYNIGGNNEQANLSLIHELCDLLDARFPYSPQVPHRQHITYVADRPGHDRRYAIDNSKICRELGYVPAETFQSGLAKTLDWYLARPEFWQDGVTLFGTHGKA
ncbi:MAG: dTDP-glucose 4,6-dehydratase [Thiothrix sp.]|uniref:dTDP-glucose 4,6-dehydratase n=1 Tax=Thiothrix sp. TaxID=1032 RepID=UPI00261D7146|nr:dTDP-glucose 4,6-dehydratase [Thiothrix sp.]MDD5392001.1 dTDP-glucose 4,6-dehydratase [Thiothrix sp.]